MERKSSKEYWKKAKGSTYESCLQRTSLLFFLHVGELALFSNTSKKSF